MLTAEKAAAELRPQLFSLDDGVSTSRIEAGGTDKDAFQPPLPSHVLNRVVCRMFLTFALRLSNRKEQSLCDHTGKT